MLNTFYRVVLSVFLTIIIGVNLAYTFNLVGIVNPTSISQDYSNMWFGFGGFVDNFKSYFEDNTIITGMNDFLHKYASFVQKMYSTIIAIPNTISALAGGTSFFWEVISMVFAILTIITNVIPTIIVVTYGLMLVLAVIIYVITFLLFVLSFFSGAFAQQLPTTYPELINPLSLAILRCSFPF